MEERSLPQKHLKAGDECHVFTYNLKAGDGEYDCGRTE